MSDRDEVVDGMDLALEEGRKLIKKNPKHELLRLLTDAGDDAIWEEFQRRFGKEGLSEEERSSHRAQAYFFGQYFLALKKAVEEEIGVGDVVYFTEEAVKTFNESDDVKNGLVSRVLLNDRLTVTGIDSEGNVHLGEKSVISGGETTPIPISRSSLMKATEQLYLERLKGSIPAG